MKSSLTLRNEMAQDLLITLFVESGSGDNSCYCSKEITLAACSDRHLDTDHLIESRLMGIEVETEVGGISVSQKQMARSERSGFFELLNNASILSLNNIAPLNITADSNAFGDNICPLHLYI